MSQTLSLYRLQQADSQIDRAQSRLQAIQKTLEDDAELRLAKEQANSTKAICQSADQALKQAEAAGESQRIKIEQTEASLYGGKGHSPKELLDLQNDVAALKRHLITLEDVQLEAMLAAEKSMSAHQAAQADLLAAQNLSAEQNRGLHEEQTALQKELEKLFAERAAVAGPIPPEALGLYDQLRQRGSPGSSTGQRRGVAVAVISEKSCSACGAGLSAAQMQSSRASGQMALCPSCGRILYGS
jgi:predicted  nucleic acid-binding Zn-ribbon protein